MKVIKWLNWTLLLIFNPSSVRDADLFGNYQLVHFESGSRHYTLPLLFYRLFIVPLSLLWGPRHLFGCFDIQQFLLLNTYLNLSYDNKRQSSAQVYSFYQCWTNCILRSWSSVDVHYCHSLNFFLQRHIWSVAPLMLLNISWHSLFSHVYYRSLMSSIPNKLPWSTWIIINAVCRYIVEGQSCSNNIQIWKW